MRGIKAKQLRKLAVIHSTGEITGMDAKAFIKPYMLDRMDTDGNPVRISVTVHTVTHKAGSLLNVYKRFKKAYRQEKVKMSAYLKLHVA